MNVVGKCFSKEIGPVVHAGSPNDDEVSLSDSIADRVETHVDALGALDLERVIGEPDGAFVIASYDCGQLRVAECGENRASPFRVLSIDKEIAIFRFSGRRYDDIKNGADGEERRIIAEESDRSGDRTAPRTTKVGGVGIHRK